MKLEEVLISIAGFIIITLLGVVAHFLKRVLDKIDYMATEMMDLKSQLNIVDFLKNEVNELKRECASLRRSFTEMDKVIYSFIRKHKGDDGP
ncbi:hypothetical protein [Adhaeribacter aquaticus]|uniref:hypothetical protein n=1 Tax=Adhaeribacter aquaticus TaxID=299567 RepID=UPI00041A836D|nr:hypothetical protein [Adhaeribacter aquaticus]